MSERPPLTTPSRGSVLSEYQQKAAGIVLYGLSFFFSVPGSDKGREVQLLEGLSWSEPTIVGEMDVRRVCDVMEKAMTPLKSMFVKGAVITAAFFFVGRTLSIVPVIPAICYFLGGATLLVTRDLYLATQQMKYAQSHFNERTIVSVDRMAAHEAVLLIDSFARQSICDMLLFGRDDSDPRFFRYVADQLKQGENTVDPSMVTQIFFPALASIAKVREMASQFAGRDEHKRK